VTRPSHCPKCRSGNISMPRYGVEMQTTTKESADDNS
jgi:hypothetical protein